MPDFKALLAKPINSYERPKTLPGGTYNCTITRYVPGESAKKKTPQVEIFLRPFSAESDVDQSELETAGIDMTQIEMRTTYYLTDKAGYRLREDAEALGIETTNRSTGEILQGMMNLQCKAAVSVGTSDDGTRTFNNVDRIFPA